MPAMRRGYAVWVDRNAVLVLVPHHAVVLHVHMFSHRFLAMGGRDNRTWPNHGMMPQPLWPGLLTRVKYTCLLSSD